MNPILRIFVFTKKFWQLYLASGVLVLATSILSLVNPFLSKKIVDTVVAHITGQNQSLNVLIGLLLVYVSVDITTTIITTINQKVGDRLAVKLQSFLSKVFYKHLLSLDISFYDNEITGRISNKMYRGITSITEFIKTMVNNFLPFFLTAFVTILVLAKFSVLIAILLAVLFPLYILISHASSKKWQQHEGEKNKINDTSQGRVFESLSGIRIVKAFGREINEYKTFKLARTKLENIAYLQSSQWHTYDFFRRLLLNVILFTIYAYIVYWTFSGRFTIGEMTLMLQLVNQARFPLFAMSFILEQIQIASSGSQDFFEILSKKSEIYDLPTAVNLHLKPEDATIHFQDVSFYYEKDKQVLHHISFDLKAGEKLALVGESGQGKSTLVNLLLRFYEPQNGNIFVDGKNIKDVTLESLHKSIAVVLQDTLLFSGTVYDNIEYANAKAGRKRVIAAAKAANAHDFIQSLPQGYNTLIGERGVKLSGGQKQRIAIARAILKNAPIIILDEATSSLDSKAEQEVQIGLDKLLHKRTAIIIAHRLSTISSADQVVVLQKGTVAEAGAPSALLKKEISLYKELVTLQSKALLESYSLST